MHIKHSYVILLCPLCHRADPVTQIDTTILLFALYHLPSSSFPALAMLHGSLPVSPPSHFVPPTLGIYPIVLCFQITDQGPYKYLFTEPIVYMYSASVYTYLQPELIQIYSLGPYSTYFNFYCSTVDYRAISIVSQSHLGMCRAP